MMQIGQVAKQAGVTVRSLRHYHKIGLLCPSGESEGGYRLYSQTDLKRLMQILFFKELGFSLADTARILNTQGFDYKKALQNHHALLQKRRTHLDGLIALSEKLLKGEQSMDLTPFDKTQLEKETSRYAAEVEARWGHTEAYRQSSEKTARYSKADWEKITGESSQLFDRFGALVDSDPASPQAQALVSQWQDFISRFYYDCTKEMLAGLGQMYMADERFKQNLDKKVPGTAAFLSSAIEVYCK